MLSIQFFSPTQSPTKQTLAFKMNPKYLRPLIPYIFIVLAFSRTCRAATRSRSQFHTFFSTFDGFYRKEIEVHCEEPFRNYINVSLQDPPNSGHLYAGGVLGCILSKSSEVTKVEMAVAGILLALVPTTMAIIGPSQPETALLSARRPFLSLLLAISTPAPSLASGSIYADPIAALGVTHQLEHLTILDRGGTALGAIISIIEYAVAVGAAANTVHLIYLLTFNAVAVAPIVVLIPGLPETAILFGWILLLVPIQLLSFAIFALTFHPKPGKTSRVRWLLDEITPCYLQLPLDLGRRGGSFWRSLASAINSFGVCAHIMLGTVLLGSVLFITLADVLPVVYRFILGAVSSRVVLLFELDGLRKARLDMGMSMGRCGCGCGCGCGLLTLEANVAGSIGGNANSKDLTNVPAARQI